MTTPSGLLAWGQSGSYDAIDDRRVIQALAAGRKGLVIVPTLGAATGLNVNVGPWLALVGVPDGTTAVIGNRDASVMPVLAGGSAARTETLWADINADGATWGPLQVLGSAALVGRTGVALGTITTPANANAASAMTFTPGAMAREPGWGPWTAFNPFSANGWSVGSPYTGAWVRKAPGEMAVISFRANKSSAGVADDGLVIATIPANDAEGNRLRPLTGGMHIPAISEGSRVDGTGRNINCRVIVNTNGNLQIYGVSNTSSWLSTAGGWYSLSQM
jgi:hypothetical protein